MSFKSLESERLLLRAFRESDLENFVSYRSNPEVARYQSWENFTREEGERFINHVSQCEFDVPGTWYQIALALKENDHLIGDLAVHTLEDARQVEIGFSLEPKHQNRGYANEAIRMLLDYLFMELEKHRVFAITDAENLPAQRLLEKLCFRLEAKYVENVWFKGQWDSEHLYAMLQREWVRLRTEKA